MLATIRWLDGTTILSSRPSKGLGLGVERRILLPAVVAWEALLGVDDEQGRTPLAWLREWPEAPRQKNLVGLVERLQALRELKVEQDRERRIHRARYAAIACEITLLVPRDVSRFDANRRLATLVVFAREMETVLTDATIVMFDKMLGGVFRLADQTHKEHVVDWAKMLDASTRALLGMAKAMLAAKASGADQGAAVERALGWERLKTLVAEADKRKSTVPGFRAQSRRCGYHPLEHRLSRTRCRSAALSGRDHRRCLACPYRSAWMGAHHLQR